MWLRHNDTVYLAQLLPRCPVQCSCSHRGVANPQSHPFLCRFLPGETLDSGEAWTAQPLQGSLMSCFKLCVSSMFRKPRAQRSQCRQEVPPISACLPFAQMLPPLLSGTSTRPQPSLLGQESHQILQARQGQAWWKREWECPEQQRQQAVSLGRWGWAKPHAGSLVLGRQWAGQWQTPLRGPSWGQIHQN